jgi:glyoxylase-like metal-dependent hydrolase (beta-lactamase superfamily II)
MPTPTFTQITPHVFKLDLPFAGGRIPVGVWLIRAEDGWTVVDAGAPGFEDVTLKQILVQTGGEIPRRLILTHGHLDHAAAAQRMRDEWKLLIAAGRAEIPYLLGPAHYNHIPGHLLYRLLQLSSPPLIGRNVQLPLDEGMRLDGLEVFEVPGHAPGMVALLHQDDRALICGDTFGNLGGKLGDPLRPFTYDPALNHQSQAKLAALDFDHLLASHGPPIMNEGRARVQALLASREKKKKKPG